MVWTCLPFIRWPNYLKRHDEREEENKADKKRCEDKIREWTSMEFAKSHRAVDNNNKQNKEETGCEVICGATTILAVKK